jgi:hypothetical protein
MKRLGPSLVIAALLAVAALFLRGKGRLPESPEAAVQKFFDAAQRGDAAAYLRLVTGPLESALRSTQSQLGADKFAADLRASVAGIKGLGITRGGGDDAEGLFLDVDITLADRNERQRFHLLQRNGGWAIDAMNRAAVGKPAVPYGTPVFEEPKPTSGKPAPAAPP